MGLHRITYAIRLALTSCPPPLIALQSRSTALHVAAENGHSAVVTALLAANCDREAVDDVRRPVPLAPPLGAVSQPVLTFFYRRYSFAS